VLTLALDTTTRAGSVAVVRDATVLSVVYGDPSRTHGERLPDDIDRALRLAHLSTRDLQLLAVASGPGAFTGLRIGLAAVQGLAMVLGVPVVAVSALDALACAALIETGNDGDSPRSGGQSPSSRDAHVLATPIAAWMDAQRGDVFAACYDRTDGERPVAMAPPVVAAPDAVLRTLPHEGAVLFVGDGAVRYEAQILHTAGARHRVLPPPAALAPHLARLAVAQAAAGEAGPPHALQPLYIRRPDAELERLRRPAAATPAAASSADSGPGDKR
jgi:tRNA threonylcarbamoyladenosine biosynthesis protein TsaB